MRVSVLVLLALVACGKVSVKAVEEDRLPNEVCFELAPDDGLSARSCLALSPQPRADLLFVVDNGPGSLALQRQLADAMPAFVDRILDSSLPYDVRVGFEVADPSVELHGPRPCDEHPDDFTDLRACEAACDGSKLASDTTRWVDIAAGASVDRDLLVETLRCGAMLGDTGAQVAEPLRSTINAWFSGDPFFRSAIQAAVIVTGGPECSRNRPNAVAGREHDEPGLAREQCYAAGILCDDLGCRTANLDHLGEETTDDDARLLPLTLVANKLDSLRQRYIQYVDPVHLYAIAPPVVAPDTEPVCDLDGTALHPAFRLAALDEQADIELASACDADWSATLRTIAETLTDRRPMCMPACVADIDDDTPGLQVECELRWEYVTSEGQFRRGWLPRCDEGKDELGCWRPATGDERHPVCAEAGFNLELELDPEMPTPPNLSILPSCDLSEEKTVDCPDL